MTRRASPPPPARPPYTLTRAPTHTQARRHLPPACASAGYGGRQQSGRPCDRTAGSRPTQSRGAGKDARGGSGRLGEAFTQPNPTPPRTPPSWGATGAALRPPRSRGGAPPPPLRRDGDAVGGPAPASPHWRAGATRTTEQYGGRAPHDPPVTTAHSGRAEGGLRSARAPGGAVHGPLLTPPPTPGRHFGPDRTRTPEGSAPATRRGPGLRTAGRRPEGEQGGRGATAPPPPPHRPASRGGPGPHPAPIPPGGGMVCPPPERGAGARPAPPAPAAGSHGGREEQASPRLRTRRPHRSYPEKPGEHEPEWYGGPGKAEGRNEAERPPALQPPPRPHNRGVRRTPPPPPPARPPAHERHGPAAWRAAPTGRAGRRDRAGPPHPHARAHNTWIADPDSPPSGRAVGGGGAHDPRRPSQR